MLIHEVNHRVYGELLICAAVSCVCRSCYYAAMRDLLILFRHVVATLSRPMGSGGVRSPQETTPDPESIPTAGTQASGI